MNDQTPNGNSLSPLGSRPARGPSPATPPRPRHFGPLDIDAHRDPRGHFLRAAATTAALVSVALAGGAAVTIAASNQASSTGGTTTAIATLVEGDHCGSDDTLGGARPGTTVAQPGTQQLSVTVPAIAVITYDRAGNVTSVMTNTGCAPRSDNQIWQTGPDTAFAEGTWEDIEHLDFVGDFTRAGTHVSQPPDPH